MRRVVGVASRVAGAGGRFGNAHAWAGARVWAANASGSSSGRDDYGGGGGQSLTQQLVATVQETLDALAEAVWPRHSPELELAGAGGGLYGKDEAEAGQEQQRGGVAVTVGELLEGVWNMGVPKSKVSPSRKRMKHLQHVPDPINWYKCTRCGEAKRPHRICTAHLDVCALSDEDYAKRVKDKEDPVSPSPYCTGGGGAAKGGKGGGKAAKAPVASIKFKRDKPVVRDRPQSSRQFREVALNDTELKVHYRHSNYRRMPLTEEHQEWLQGRESDREKKSNDMALLLVEAAAAKEEKAKGKDKEGGGKDKDKGGKGRIKVTK